MNQARNRTAGNTLLMRITSNLYIKIVVQGWPFSCNRAFSHDVTEAILVSQTNPVGIELFSYVNAFLLFP